MGPRWIATWTREGAERSMAESEQRERSDGAAPSPMREGVSRRSFVIASAGSAAVLLGVGGVGALTGGRELLRPPGGQNEARLVAQCNRCGRCASACHTRAIGVAHLADGVVNARTPVMRFNLGECDFCGDCAKACPTGALAPFDVEAARGGDVSAARIGVAALSPSICLSYTSSSCNLCYTECPYEAVELDGSGNPFVVEDRCNGCGVCENVCPVLSLRSYIGGSTRAITVVHVDGVKERDVDNER